MRAMRGRSIRPGAMPIVILVPNSRLSATGEFRLKTGFFRIMEEGLGHGRAGPLVC